jgi:outer membrane usher protein
MLICTIERLAAEEIGHQVQLEVIVNDTPTQLIGAFVLLDNKRIAARRQELEEIGLNPRGYASPDQLVVLDDLNGLAYRYDEPTQRIFIAAPDELRVTKEYKVAGKPQESPPMQSDYGSVLNYSLFSSADSRPKARSFALNGASATLDARAFTPYGTFSQSGILRNSLNDRFEALRLNTVLTYSDSDSLTTYRAGDAINSGLAWTRPIRMGGLQVQRNFGLRPDLITLPLPAAEGSAAVPSTADVYINNIRTFSQDIGTGPYRLSNLPAVAGSGTARVVLRDASGRETETSLPFYASAALLAPGLFDYSIEAGLPRLSYGTTSDTYVAKPIASGSIRYGIFDWLTIAGHLETGAGLVNGSSGIMARTGSFGVASFAVAASHYQKATGFQTYLSYETKLWDISISASSQLTFGPYDDLASVTARLQSASADSFGLQSFLDISSSVNSTAPSLFTNARAPKALNRVSVGVPLPFERTSLSATVIQTNDAAGNRSSIVTATLTAGLPYEASFFATAFTTFAGEKNTGFLAGISFPIGKSATASTSVSNGPGGTNVNFDAAKPLDLKPGSVGWRFRDSEGGAAQRSAAVAYRSSFARGEAGVSQDRNGTLITADVEGAVATMGGGVFFANRIDDAFAVVETGAPGVEVFHENRSVGITDSAGRALVPGLRSYQPNKISIDTSSLPVDADITTTESIVAPADRMGVRMNFAVQVNVRPAIVVFKHANGEPLAAGSQGQVEGGDSFIVGYDGQAYIKNLAAENKATITLVNGECRAAFSYSPRPNEQVVISPVLCR